MILHVASTHVAVDRLLSRVMSTSVMEPSLVELVGSNLTKGILIFSRTSAEVATIALVDWVACSARSPLLSQLGFGNRLRYRVVVLMASTVTSTGEHDIVSSLIEKLSSHHHLLLLTCVCIRSLSLVHQVKQMSLVCSSVLMSHSTRRSDSIVTNA